MNVVNLKAARPDATTGKPPERRLVWLFQCVLLDPTLDASAKVVAALIANHCNKGGTTCFPAIETLADEGSLSEKTVRRAIKALIDRGTLKRTRRSRTTSNLYQVILNEHLMTEVKDEQALRKDDRTRRREARERGHDRSPMTARGGGDDRSYTTKHDRSPTTAKHNQVEQHQREDCLQEVVTDSEPVVGAASSANDGTPPMACASAPDVDLMRPSPPPLPVDALEPAAPVHRSWDWWRRNPAEERRP